MLTMLKPEDMDEMLAMDYLDELEFSARQMAGDLSQEDTETRQKTEELIGRVKERMEKCLKQRQEANYRTLRKSNLSQAWRLKKLVDACPSLVLHEPDDFILYWYVHGEFPCGMSLWDMGQTRRKLETRLNRLRCGEESDSTFVAYRREKINGQLQQLQEMTEAFPHTAWREEAYDYGEEALECPDEDTEVGHEGSDGEPVFLYLIPDEPEHPEDMTIPELAWEIEKKEYNLFELKSAENGEEGRERPIFWQESVDYGNALLRRLRGLLRQRLLEALGAEVEDSSVPAEFQDGELPILLGGDKLDRPEDIVASWYLSDSFPLIVSGEKLLLVEAELKRQQAKLEAEEPEDETEHAVWQFRMEQRAEQLDEIQNMMWNQATDWEEWDPEEDSADE